MLQFFSQRFGANGFLNEKLWLGHLGHLFIVFSFCASILACISYFTAEFSSNETKRKSWRNLARVAFLSQR